MIENLIKNFTCPTCSSQIKENSIEIIGAAGSTVNIDIECPACKKHALIKAELAYTESNPTLNLSKDKLEALKDVLKSFSGTLLSTNEETLDQLPATQNYIKDEEIVELSQSLKNKKITAFDLFNESGK